VSSSGGYSISVEIQSSLGTINSFGTTIQSLGTRVQSVSSPLQQLTSTEQQLSSSTQQLASAVSPLANNFTLELLLIEKAIKKCAKDSDKYVGILCTYKVLNIPVRDDVIMY
jgi:hypothetical protein